MPKVVIMCDEGSYGRYPHQRDLDRLGSFAEVEFVACGPPASPDPVVEGVNAMPRSTGGGRGAVAINGGHTGYGAAGEIITDEDDKTAATVAALAGADAVVSRTPTPPHPAAPTAHRATPTARRLWRRTAPASPRR